MNATTRREDLPAPAKPDIRATGKLARVCILLDITLFPLLGVYNYFIIYHYISVNQPAQIRSLLTPMRKPLQLYFSTTLEIGSWVFAELVNMLDRR